MKREPEDAQPGCIALPEVDPNKEDKDYEMAQYICPACNGCGEYQTERKWLPCHYCKGKGEI